MLDYDDLGESIVCALRLNHDFLEAVGMAPSDLNYYFRSYPERTTANSAVEQLTAPSALLVWTGTQFIERSNGIEHGFSLFVVPRGSGGGVLRALRDGVISGGTGLPFKFYQFRPECHAVDVTGSQMRPIVISQQAIIEIQEIFMRVTETGADN